MGLLVVAALLWFIIEMVVWYLVAQIGTGVGWLVFAWFIVAAIVGVNLIKKTVSTLSPIAKQAKAGNFVNPAGLPKQNTLAKSLFFGLAGLLFLVPGLISDALAVVFLLPVVQNRLTAFGKNYVMKNQAKFMQMAAARMGGQNPFGAQNPFGQNPFGAQHPFGQGAFGGNTVDSSATVVKNKPKHLSANDEK